MKSSFLNVKYAVTIGGFCLLSSFSFISSAQNSYQQMINSMGFQTQQNSGQSNNQPVYTPTPITPSTINDSQTGQIIYPNGTTSNVLIQDTRQPGTINGGVYITPVR